jgi:hypothetical protein
MVEHHQPSRSATDVLCSDYLLFVLVDLLIVIDEIREIN